MQKVTLPIMISRRMTTEMAMATGPDSGSDISLADQVDNYIASNEALQAAVQFAFDLEVQNVDEFGVRIDSRAPAGPTSNKPRRLTAPYRPV